MSIIKFRKVPELFPNRKVRTVRTEQLWLRHCDLNDLSRLNGRRTAVES